MTGVDDSNRLVLRNWHAHLGDYLQGPVRAWHLLNSSVELATFQCLVGNAQCNAEALCPCDLMFMMTCMTRLSSNINTATAAPADA